MGVAIKGLTSTGRATIEVLKMNAPRKILLKSRLVANGEI